MDGGWFLGVLLCLALMGYLLYLDITDPGDEGDA